MEQYIPKSALVAEINRVLNSYDPNEITSGRYALVSLRNFLDTLEVKDIDLDKEIDNWYQNKASKEFERVFYEDIEECCKHFFELGLSVNNPTTEADRCTAEEIIINLKRVEQDYRIDLTREIEWLRNKVKKGA